MISDSYLMSYATKDKTKGNVRSTKRSLPIALLRAREKVMFPLRQMLLDAGVTEQQWRVLRVVDEQGPSDATEIAHSACLLMPSLTRILQHLEAEGHCTRRSDTKDRRRMIVEITESGRGLIAKNADRANEIFQQIETEFGSENYETLINLLAQFVGETDA